MKLTELMNFKVIKKEYGYLVSVIPNGRNYCNYPKEQPRYNRFRGFSRIYFDNTYIKKITYPPELILSWVDKDDKIEQELIDIQNEWPNWYKIEVFNLKKK